MFFVKIFGEKSYKRYINKCELIDCWDEEEGVWFGEGGWFFMGWKCVFLEIVDYVLFG